MWDKQRKELGKARISILVFTAILAVIIIPATFKIEATFKNIVNTMRIKSR